MGEIQPQDDMATLLAMAKEEWETAYRLFETASEPDLIDAAIHQIVAAEKRFSYLLRMAKDEGNRADGPFSPVL